MNRSPEGDRGVSQRTQLLNGLRGHLTEVGVIAAQGPRHARELAELIEACDETVPFEVCEALAALVVQLRNLDEAIARLDRTIAKLAQKDETARRLMSIPGFGPITASAMAATIQDTSSFAGPREFAAFLGLTPKQNSSGGKPKLGRISKMGNRNLRKLLVVGAHAVLFHRKPHTNSLRMWAKKLIKKKPFKLVAVALAWPASPSQFCGARRSIGKFRVAGVGRARGRPIELRATRFGASVMDHLQGDATISPSPFREQPDNEAPTDHIPDNGQVERMNRTIKDATVKRYHYELNAQLVRHLDDFVAAYNFARRLKTLNGLTPYEFVCKTMDSRA